MAYYANGGGQVVLKDGVKAPIDVWKMLCQDFSEVADSPDGGIYLTFEENKYHDDEVRESMGKLAPFVTSGNVEFTGEDGEQWRFHFWNGTVQYQTGRVVYEPETPDERNQEKMALLCDSIEAFEEMLDEKGIVIPNEEKDEDQDSSNIYGSDYGDLESRIEEILIKYELLKEEK